MHHTAFRVYYEDTDFSGFVYHANYLRFLERGRTDYLRAIGVTQSDLHRDGLVLVVTRLVIDYRRPAKMDDLVTVATAVDAVRGASLAMRQALRRGDDLLVEATVDVAAVRDGRATRLPPNLRAALDVGGRTAPSS